MKRRFYQPIHEPCIDSREGLAAALRDSARQFRARLAQPTESTDRDPRNARELQTMAAAADEFAAEVEQELLVRLPTAHDLTQKRPAARRLRGREKHL